MSAKLTAAELPDGSVRVTWLGEENPPLILRPEARNCILLEQESDTHELCVSTVGTRVLPRLPALIARDRAGNGYKEARR